MVPSRRRCRLQRAGDDEENMKPAAEASKQDSHYDYGSLQRLFTSISGKHTILGF